MANSVKSITNKINDPELLGAVEDILNTTHAKKQPKSEKEKRKRKERFSKFSKN